MKIAYSVLIITMSLLAACSSQQLGSAVAGSLGASECKEKTGGLACDLDERSTDERLINGALDLHSTEALAKSAKKVREANEKPVGEQ